MMAAVESHMRLGHAALQRQTRSSLTELGDVDYGKCHPWTWSRTASGSPRSSGVDHLKVVVDP